MPKTNISFDQFIWETNGYQVTVHYWDKPEEIIIQSELSRILARKMKRTGLTFVGPKLIYAYMQVIGMVNDHCVDVRIGKKY